MTIFGGWHDKVGRLANTTVLRFGESMTSSIFGGGMEEGRRSTSGYHLPIDQHSDQRCTGRRGGGGGGEEGEQLKKYDGRTEVVLLGRVGNGSKEGKVHGRKVGFRV